MFAFVISILEDRNPASFQEQISISRIFICKLIFEVATEFCRPSFNETAIHRNPDQFFDRDSQNGEQQNEKDHI